ncbi:MAG: molecular chaperone [Alphaproteobacteria bacterium]|nr:molecular chaperone [Alphaproteobacteria bacterium]
MTKTLKLFLSFLTLALIFALIPAPASATFVTPKRIMIKDGQQAATVTIQNRNKQAMVYQFGWERRVQTPDGKFKNLKDGETIPGYRPADDMFIFSPRQVIVQPGQTQRVRILVRRPADLAPGEYHSHLHIMPDPLSKAEAPEVTQRGVGGILEMRTRMSIPVFLRQGPTSVNFQFSQSRLVDDGEKRALTTTIDNNSTRSIYAKPVMHCTKADGSVIDTVLPTLRLYAEAKHYDHKFSIPKTAPAFSECSAIKVSFEGLQDPEYHAKVITEINLK